MKRWARAMLATVFAAGCTGPATETGADSAVEQRVDAILGRESPIAYVAIPPKVVSSRSILVQVLVSNVENPALVPVDVSVSLCVDDERPNRCGPPFGSLSLFPPDRPGAFVLRLPEAVGEDPSKKHAERVLKFELKLSSEGPRVLLKIERVTWLQ